MTKISSLISHRSSLVFFLAIGVIALAAQFCELIGSATAIRARVQSNQNQPLVALATAGRASAWYPWQPDAAMTRLISLERLGRWNEMLDAGKIAVWHPYSPAVLCLLGEAQARLGDPKSAAETLWQSFWRAPHPRDNPAQLWRLAMVSGAQAWGPSDPRTLAAARRTLDMIPVDPNLRPEDRVNAQREAEAILGRSGSK